MQKKFSFLFLFILLYVHTYCQCPLIKQWDKRYGGNNNEWLSFFKQSNDGGFILGGTSASGVSGDIQHPSNGNKDFWIVKTDSIGNLMWEKNYGGANDEILHYVLQTSDGGYLLGGNTNSANGGDVSVIGFGFFDYWIVKIDANGNKLWDQRFGGSDVEELTSMDQTQTGDFVLAGSSKSDISGSKTQSSWGLEDFWVVKTDSLGNLQWEKRFGGFANDHPFSVKINSTGDIILGGTSESGIGGDKTQPSRGMQDYWVVKTDINGSVLCDNRYGGAGDDTFCTMSLTTNDNLILAGFSQSGVSGDKSQPLQGLSDYWIIKTDPGGSILWDRDYGGFLHDEFVGNISVTMDDGLLIAGTSYSNAGGDKTNNNMSTEQMWIIKTDSAGTKLWDKTILNLSVFDDEVAYAIQTSDTGYAVANYTFANIGGDKSELSQGGSDYWLLKFSDTTGIGFPPFVTLSVSDTVFCGKQCLDFTDLSTNNPTSWNWLFQGAVPASSTDQNPIHICYNSFGVFDVSLVACNGAGCDSIFLPAFINELQNPSVPVITQNGVTLVSTLAYSYSWFSTNNSSMVLSTDSFYTPVSPGSYYVVICDIEGCCVSSGIFVLAGINQNNHKAANFLITEFPESGNIQVIARGLFAKEITLSVYSLLGQKVMTVTDKNILGEYKKTLQTSMNNAGIYILEIIIDQQIIHYFNIAKL